VAIKFYGRFSMGKSNTVLFLGRKLAPFLRINHAIPPDFKKVIIEKPFHRKSPPAYREIKKFLTRLF